MKRIPPLPVSPEFVQMTSVDREKFFMDNARYMKDAPQTPYFIRFGSRFLCNSDTMELRKEFERVIRNARRRKARTV